MMKGRSLMESLLWTHVLLLRIYDPSSRQSRRQQFLIIVLANLGLADR